MSLAYPCLQGKLYCTTTQARERTHSPECCTSGRLGQVPHLLKVSRCEDRRVSFPYPFYHIADKVGMTCSLFLMPSEPAWLCPWELGHLCYVAQERCKTLSPECFSRWRAGPTLYIPILSGFIRVMDQVMALGNRPNPDIWPCLAIGQVRQLLPHHPRLFRSVSPPTHDSFLLSVSPMSSLCTHSP